MGIEIKENILKLSHFSLWGLFMWLFVGLLFVAVGIFMANKTVLGIIFIIVGILSLVGVFLLKRIFVVFDKDSNTVKRHWQAWTGISKKTKSIPIDKIQSIVYEREVAYATIRKTGIKQRFFLFAEVSDGSRFYFFPTTYTPHKAEENGKKIAKFLGINFKKEETKTDSPVFRSREKDEHKSSSNSMP